MSTDFSPLERAVPSDQVARLWAEVAAGAYGDPAQEWARGSGGRAKVAPLMIGGLLGLVVVITIVVQLVQGDDDAVGIGLVFLALVAAICGLVYGLGRLAESRRRQQFARLDAFARANGFEARPAVGFTKRGTLVRGKPAHTTVLDHVSWEAAGAHALVETLHWSNAGRNPDSNSRRYLAVQVGPDVPRLVVLVKGHRSGHRPEETGSPADDTGTHVLLAGRRNHDRARAFLTPDLLALLTARGAQTHAEVVDGWFVAHVQGTDPVDVARWQQLVALADAARAAADLVPPRPIVEPAED